MDTLEKVRKHLKNPDATGFFVEVNNRSLTVKRINEWQWDVVSENAGMTNLYPALSAHQVVELVEDKIGNHDCFFNPFDSLGTENEALNRFMTGLSFQMCKPYINGFVFSGKDIPSFTIRKVASVNWELDGKIFSFAEARKIIRGKLATTSNWKYEEV